MSNTRDLGSGTVEIDGESYATKTLDVVGIRHTIRELSVDEGSEVLEMARQPNQSINEILNIRGLLAKAIIEPAYTIDRVGKFGSRKYLLLLRAFNELNNLPEDNAGNPTPPAGSAEPTSPSGGAPSPTPSDDSPAANTSGWSASQPTP